MSDFIPEKYVQNGEVAILISPGFGAGWSTWADEEISEFLLFHKPLVEMAQRNATASEVEKYLEKGGIEYIYMGGWSDIKIGWLLQGTPFYVHEQDGSESVTLIESLHITA